MSVGSKPITPCVLEQWEPFPSDPTRKFTVKVGFPGMTYRQWLIGMALQGACSVEIHRDGTYADEVARVAIKHADAILQLLDWQESKKV